MILNGKVSAFFLIMCNLARPHRIFFAQLTFCHHCMDVFRTSSIIHLIAIPRNAHSLTTSPK